MKNASSKNSALSANAVNLIQKLIREGISIESIASEFKLHPNLVRHFIHFDLMNRHNSPESSISSIDSELRSFKKNIELTGRQPSDDSKALRDAKELAKVLYLLDCSAAQVHRHTGITMNSVRTVFKDVRLHFGKEKTEYCRDLPANFATRIFTSIFLHHFRRAMKCAEESRTRLLFNNVSNVNNGGSDINVAKRNNRTSLDEMQLLKAAFTAWEATAAEIAALEIKPMLKETAAVKKQRKEHKKELYNCEGRFETFGTFLFLARDIAVNDLVGDERHVTWKWRMLKEDVCTNRRCGRNYVYFYSLRKPGEKETDTQKRERENEAQHQCPFCQLEAELKATLARNKKPAVPQKELSVIIELNEHRKEPEGDLKA